ncbi:MAG: glycosyltransferase family 2 protein [Planctomycetota bacterium]|jgi:GT2 family glycosyltransferase|nr:glycosyltransferase family 2 protein [Planctomycetota bacterium]MDP6837944.1 glycosyltransferase family 2 protein [Planctomycetota bacterium]
MSASPAPICVVVINHNGRDHLSHCLDSVLALEGPVERVLVVDNASDDGSLELIAQRYPGVEVLARDKNDGPAGARNAGLERVNSEWVLLLDNDVILEQDCLLRLAAAATSRPDVALVQPRSVFDTERERVHYDGGAPHFLGLVALRNFYSPLDKAAAGSLVEVGTVISLALLVHRRSVLACGGFDPDYFILFEDLDLSYRLRLEGKSLLLDETTLVRHRGGTPQLSFRGGADYPAQRIFLHSRNRWLFLARNLRARTLLVSLPGLLVYELVYFLFALGQGAAAPWWRGKRDFLRLLPGTRIRRRQTAARRLLPDRWLLVGGPLVVTPDLARGPRALLQRALDLTLRAWWLLARPLAG